jgi:phosphoribosylaminoimidazole-succinocarboxamide synthase
VQQAVTKLELPGVPLFSRGKVRETFDLGDRLLMVATDRISAYDSVLPNGVPAKGIILTQFARFWFETLRDLVPNHLVTTELIGLPQHILRYQHLLHGRSMIVRKASRIDIECVARGYISGSAWAEYQQSGTVCGHQLPPGLQESDRLPEPIFTPATKAQDGQHDENISVDRMAEIVGPELTDQLQALTISIYQRAEEFARQRGIIIADTKLEFGMINGELTLIDEVLTPDSSRFWDAELYNPGTSQPSFDKQIVRDWLTSSGWDREPPAPALPAHVALRTAQRYYEVFQRLTGQTLEIDLTDDEES